MHNAAARQPLDVRNQTYLSLIRTNTTKMSAVKRPLRFATRYVLPDPVNLA
jgi:hypothetical protein